MNCNGCVLCFHIVDSYPSKWNLFFVRSVADLGCQLLLLAVRPVSVSLWYCSVMLWLGGNSVICVGCSIEQRKFLSSPMTYANALDSLLLLDPSPPPTYSIRKCDDLFKIFLIN